MFPAHAGMNRVKLLPRSVRPGVPRPRGDEPSTSGMLCWLIACSPPARG